jgi:hypothetical protein
LEEGWGIQTHRGSKSVPQNSLGIFHDGPEPQENTLVLGDFMPYPGEKLSGEKI